MLNKDVATLSQWLQHIMLHYHQYNVPILYKPGPEFYIADWLPCHNHAERREQEIAGMNINIQTIKTTLDVPVCMSIKDIRVAMNEDVDLQMLKTYIIRGWAHNKAEVEAHIDILANKA